MCLIGVNTISSLYYFRKNTSVLTLFLKQLLYDNKDIPSLAYGYKTCSIDHKIRPVEKYLRDNGIKRHIGVIGYGVGEIDRAFKALDSQTKIRDSKKREETKFNLRVFIIRI